MNPRDIKPQIGTPTNRLFWAINHYVSTGDHIGEGVAQEVGGKLLFLIPVRVAAEQDQRDLAAFRARFDELAEPYQTAMRYMGEYDGFELWGFALAEDQADDLAADLTVRPGALGWGSGKAVIDSYTWGDA